MTQYYKWMLPGRVTATRRKKWPVAGGEWTPKETPVLCKSGWHGMDEKGVLSHLPATLGAELWVVERRGKVDTGVDKFAAESIRLVHHVGTTDERNLRLFAADCAEDVLHLFEEAFPRDDRPRKAIEAARMFARGEIGAAAWDAARDAACYAAGDAAGDAAWCAACYAACYAAGAAAGEAGGDAPWDAARAAAGAAAGDEAWAAAGARYSNWLVYRLWGGEGDEG